MLSDIEIAQSTTLRPIAEIAAELGIQEDELELYGKYKAKINERAFVRLADKPNGKLVLVTAINPTPAGEGKTTTTAGLGQAMKKIGKNAIISLREPSLGPVFGIKGGAAGGGYAQVLPMEDINLHFTGDMHAITSANNLCCAMLDNHLQQGNTLGIDPRRIQIKRCLDMNDRALRNIVIGLGGKINGVPREDGFIITVASEVMAILCLAKDMNDLKERLGNILIAYTYAGEPVYARDIKAEGAMAALLRDAVNPNLVQTIEGTPPLRRFRPGRGKIHGHQVPHGWLGPLLCGGGGYRAGAEIQRRRTQGGALRRECPRAREGHCQFEGPCGEHAEVRRACGGGHQPLRHRYRCGTGRYRPLLPGAGGFLRFVRGVCQDFLL